MGGMYVDVLFTGPRDARGISMRAMYQAYTLPFRDLQAFGVDDPVIADIIPALPGMRLLELVELPGAGEPTWTITETPVLRWLVNHDQAIPIFEAGLNDRDLGGHLAVEMPRAMVVGAGRYWSSRAAWIREMTEIA